MFPVSAVAHNNTWLETRGPHPQQQLSAAPHCPFQGRHFTIKERGHKNRNKNHQGANMKGRQGGTRKPGFALYFNLFNLFI